MTQNQSTSSYWQRAFTLMNTRDSKGPMGKGQWGAHGQGTERGPMDKGQWWCPCTKDSEGPCTRDSEGPMDKGQWGAHGQGTVMVPMHKGQWGAHGQWLVFGLHFGWGSLVPRRSWTLFTLSTRLLRPWKLVARLHTWVAIPCITSSSSLCARIALAALSSVVLLVPCYHKHQQEKEMFDLKTHSEHFIYGYMVSGIW